MCLDIRNISTSFLKARDNAFGSVSAIKCQNEGIYHECTALEYLKVFWKQVIYTVVDLSQ